jgi:hypothetical protein
MPVECELKGVRLAIKKLELGEGPVWLIPSLKKRERVLAQLALDRKRRAREEKTAEDQLPR